MPDYYEEHLQEGIFSSKMTPNLGCFHWEMNFVLFQNKQIDSK